MFYPILKAGLSGIIVATGGQALSRFRRSDRHALLDIPNQLVLMY
jgi:hypothetical protein